MSDNAVSKDAIVIERIFDVPVDLIWQLWTQPEHFKAWYGPTGFRVPVAEMDVRIGGKRLVCMESPDGSMKLWTTGEYTEIVPNQRLAYTESFSDENGDIVAPPNSAPPMTTTVTVQLEDLGGQTRMVMTHAGMPGNQGANEGWNQAFGKLAHLVETIRRAS